MAYSGPERREDVRSRRQSDNGWHLDKRVPLALVFLLLAQSFGFGWWGSAIQKQVEVNVRSIDKLDSVPERLLVIETLIRRMEAQQTKP